MELKELESAIEGILFAAGDPVPVERLCLTLEQDRETVDNVCQRLADQYRYERRGIRVLALEVLAIIAYFQPVTRAYIEQVRGVDSSYTVGLLLERELICEAGRLAVPGRPMQFKTTKNFLRSFGLSTLEDLPELPASMQEGTQLSIRLGPAIRQLQPDGKRKEDAAAGEEAQ